MMNSNPWNVASIDDFSFFNCPECDFHTKEKKNFQDHATRNHPLSAVLFSEEVITFLNELNQLKNLTNDQKCEELVLKQNLSDPVSSFKNDVSNVEKRQQLQKVSEETKKDFSLPTEIVKIISLQKEEKLEKNINTFHPLPTIPCEDQNESSGVLREEFLESNKAINFSGIRVEVIEVDYNDVIPSKLQQNIAQIDSSNSNVLISSVNCDEFQEFQTVLPSDTELTVSSVHDQIKCLICSESFPSKNQLKEHITSVHDEVKQYPCSKCGKCFSRIKLLLDHIYVVHEEKKMFQCSLCDYKSKLQGNVTSHTIRVHEEFEVREIHDGKQNLHCEICNVSFEKEINLKLHQKSRHHKKEILNRNAPVQLKSKKKIEKSDNKIKESTNIDTSTNDTLLMSKNELLNCKLCNHSFRTKGNLDNHFAAVHELKKPFECKICKKTLSRKDKLKDHILTVHETLKLFQCSICDHKTMTKGAMKSHTNSIHKGLDIEIIDLRDKKYKCYNCDFKTGVKRDLNKHICKVHEGKNIIKKLKAAQDFSNESVHERKKEGITQSLRSVRKEERKTSNAFMEDLSIEKFIENYDPLEVNHAASVHEESDKTNTGNGPIVPFLFGGINSHVKPIQQTKIVSSVHEERKPYNCSFCDVSFLNKEHVKEHILIVHEGM